MGTREEMQGTMGTCIGCGDYKVKKDEKMKKKQTAGVADGMNIADIARKRCEIPSEDLYANLMGKQTEMRPHETEKKLRTHCEGFETERHEEDDEDDDAHG